MISKTIGINITKILNAQFSYKVGRYIISHFLVQIFAIIACVKEVRGFAKPSSSEDSLSPRRQVVLI